MTSDAQDRFWAWSLETYGRAGIADLCLDVQDRFGGNVNLVLFCGWRAAEGQTPLDGAALAHLAAITARWSDQVTKPLRQVRRDLKAPPDGVPGTECEIYREKIKSLELESERMEQAILVRAAAIPPQIKTLPDADTIRQNALASLHAYAPLLTDHIRTGPGVNTLLKRLVYEMFPPMSDT